MKNNLFTINESEKKRILNLHETFKLKNFGLMTEATAVPEYLNAPRVGDPYDYLKVGDENSKYYYRLTNNPTGYYKTNPTYVKKLEDLKVKNGTDWKEAVGKNLDAIKTKIKFKATPEATSQINVELKTNDEKNNNNSDVDLDGNQKQELPTLKVKAPEEIKLNNSSDTIQTREPIDYKLNSRGQINTTNALKQIENQEKEGEKLIKLYEKNITKSCLVPVKNIEKSYFGKGLFRREKTQEEINKLLSDDTIKKELIKNLTELLKPIYLPGVKMPISTGKRCVDYDRIKRELAKFPNFKPEELAKKVGLNVESLKTTPKNIEVDKKIEADINLSNQSGPRNTETTNDNNQDQQKLDYLRSQLNVPNNTKPEVDIQIPGEEPEENNLAKGKR